MTLTEQLWAAFEASGMTIGELLDKSGLQLDRSSLQRKIRGQLPMKVDELERLAVVLGRVLVFPLPTPTPAHSTAA